MTYALVVFMLGTGPRLNEACALMIGDVDFANCAVTVRSETSKFRKGRTTYMHKEVAHELDRYLWGREDNWRDDPRNAALWVNRSGDPFTIDAFGKVFLRLKNKSGIEHFSAHVCRHTWATDFMKQPGASLLELKRQGGWAKWEMVERYSHVAPPRDRDAPPTRSPLNRLQSKGHSSQVSRKPPIRFELSRDFARARYRPSRLTAHQEAFRRIADRIFGGFQPQTRSSVKTFKRHRKSKGVGERPTHSSDGAADRDAFRQLL